MGPPAAANKASAAIPLERLIFPPTGVIVAAETLQSLIAHVTHICDLQLSVIVV
jgi:hypothetical protein